MPERDRKGKRRLFLMGGTKSYQVPLAQRGHGRAVPERLDGLSTPLTMVTLRAWSQMVLSLRVGSSSCVTLANLNSLSMGIITGLLQRLHKKKNSSKMHGPWLNERTR